MARFDACRMSRPTLMFEPMPKVFSTLTIVLLLTAGPANAQFFGYPPTPGSPPQYRDQPYQQQQQRPQAPSQPRPQPKAQPQLSAPTPPAQTQPAPYDHDLQRLAEILGALHFLRGICGTNEGQKWRDQAQALIDTEAPTGDRHDQMIAGFNRGYRSFQQSYRTCTPAAVIVIRRYLEEGASIAREVTARYAN
jgi:uncharacterized protein (TIGR02301 family)